MYDMDTIYRTYFTDVYRYLVTLCRDAELAEELTQETFWKALQHIDRFRGDCSLFVWLCGIAKNAFLSHARRQKRSIPVDTPPEQADTGRTVEERMMDADTADCLHRILHELAEPYKEVFTLRTLGELPFAKIAALFGKTESWARVTYHRAKLMIKEKLP